MASTISIGIVGGNPERATLLSDYLSKDFARVKAFPCVYTLLSEVNLHPSIVLLDMNIPGMNVADDVIVIKRKFTGTEIIMMSSLCDSERVLSSICAGASGYVERESPLPEIKNAIIDLSRGGFPITPEMTRRVFNHLQPPTRMSASLTKREHDVVQGLVAGLSYKLTAAKLNMSIDTVRKHIRNIYSKLNINSKGELLMLYRNVY